MSDLDISTGKPRETWDNTPEIARKFAGLYEDRKGEVLHVLFVGNLTALGQCFGPGDRLEIEVASSRWWETVDA